MNTRLTVILSKGKEHLCYEDEDCLVDVSYPMMTFTAGEDEFEIVPVDSPVSGRTFRYHGRNLSVVPEMYCNGWPALCLKEPDTEELYTVLTVNLESAPAFSLPDKAFIDIGNNPDAMEFLQSNRLAEDTGYRRQSGWVSYPMVTLDLPMLYRVNPQAFNAMLGIPCNPHK